MKGGMANGVDLTGLLGGHKRLGVWGRKSPSGVQGWNPGRGPKAEAFFVKLHNICVKIQQTTVAVTQVDILNDITSKILILRGDMSPCPIEIDTHGDGYQGEIQ